MKIYHNPRCTKSRETLALLRSEGVEPEIVEYLKEIPTADEMKKLLAKLNMNASELIRTGEQLYKEKFKGKQFNEDEWIQIMIENPKLIERPIVVKDYKAVIGRPPENVRQLI